MKSLVLSAVICAATAGSTVATSLPIMPAHHSNVSIDERATINTFKQVIAFHQRNVDVLWEQYGLAEARIKGSRGSHAELDRDQAYFIAVYEQDIAKGVRVEESKEAISDIKASYAKKHAKRDAYEKVQLAKLQDQLLKELKDEQSRFARAKKKYADLVNDETLPLLQAAEAHFAKAIERAKFTNEPATSVAAR